MTDNKRIANHITNKDDINFLLSLTEEKINKTLIVNLFGKINGKRRFNTYDIITIPPNSYGNPGKMNKNSFDTTIGIWIFNKFFIEKDLFNELGYINNTCGQGVYDDINKKLSHAVMEDRISVDTLERYIMKNQFFQQFSTMLCSSYSEKALCCSTEINKKKKEIVEKYKKEIESGDPVIAAKIEKELIDFAKQYLDGDPSLDMFYSGTRGSFGNQFKNMFIMKGAIKSTDPNGGYNISMSNYIDGIPKEEYSVIADSLIEGPYARAKKTEIGGYWEKLFLSAFQHVILGEPGSDCGTKRYITINLNKSNIDGFLYSYIIEGDNLVELNSTNIDKYINTTVKIRFSSLCESEHICNKCAGNIYYKLGIKNIGVSTPQIPSIIKNLSMKSFHNSVVDIAEMDPMKAFGLK